MEIFYGLLVVGFIFATLGWKLVPHEHIGIIEKLGVYHEELVPGLYFRIPFVFQMRNIIKVVPQVVELESITLSTKDDRLLELKASLTLTIVNPKLYTYELKRPYAELNDKLELIISNEILRTNYEDLGNIIDDLNTLVLNELTDKTVLFGIKLERVSLKKIIK